MSKLNPGVDYEFCYNELLYTPLSICFPSIFDGVATLKKKRGRNKDSQLAALLRAVTCLDLTTLNGDDSSSNLLRLCHKATDPITKDILTSLKFNPSEISCAAVCVYPAKVSNSVEILDSLGSSVPVAAVAAGFPSGQYDMKSKLEEIACCIKDNAKEIDIVISRDLALRGEWEQLYEEVKCLRAACEGVKMKAIIAAGELGSFANVYKSSIVCMAAGADFIKTSTGKEYVNATLPVGTVMVRAIKDYYHETGYKVGFKPAGGIRISRDVLLWQELMIEELGGDWLCPDLFRIGASSLLDDIERTIIQHVDPIRSDVNVLPYM